VIVNNITNNNDVIIMGKTPEQSQKVQKPKGILVNSADAGKKPASKGSDSSKAKDAPKVHQQLNTGISMEIEKDLNIVVAKILDKESGKVIRQIPPNKMIGIMKAVKEMLAEKGEEKSGLIVDKEV